MLKKNALKPVSAIMGTAFAVSLAASPLANATENPFGMSELSNGYMVADGHAEGKCGEGKCGEAKEAEGKCGEGKCGEAKEAEGKCGEGKCGEAKEAEGKCGEGKCGGSK
ncbi:MAG: hypothetical protein AB8D52_03265 [Gammaproteobacteria bacterium]